MFIRALPTFADSAPPIPLEKLLLLGSCLANHSSRSFQISSVIANVISLDKRKTLPVVVLTSESREIFHCQAVGLDVRKFPFLLEKFK